MNVAPEPPNILVICTANVCRSPVAERLLDRHLNATDLSVTVTSAGTHGGRNTVHPHTLSAAAGLGVDLSDHASRRLTRRLLDSEGADLVIALSRDHLYHVIATDEATWPRTFTLTELARRADALAATGVAVDGFDTWVAALSDGRQSRDLMPGRRTDDIADPYGRARRHHRSMIRTVDHLSAQLARSAASSFATPSEEGPGSNAS